MEVIQTSYALLAQSHLTIPTTTFFNIFLFFWTNCYFKLPEPISLQKFWSNNLLYVCT